MIHSTAIISEKAKIGENPKIGPYVIIEDDVEIGDNVEIQSSAVIYNGARIGNNVRIFPGAIISAEPQDLKYDGEPTKAIIGKDTVIREYATVHRGTSAHGTTRIGENCLIMAYCHIAHDCIIGDNVIMSNVTQLAGHVTVGDWVVFGGVAKVTQFCTVGKHCMVGADVKVVKDVAPYCLVGKIPVQVEGINKVGLKRRGFSMDEIQEIQEFYNTLLFSGLNNSDGIRQYKATHEISSNIKECIEFIENSKRGIHR